MTTAPEPGTAATPAWVRRIVRDEIRHGEQALTDAMMANGEDPTDNVLGAQRKSRFLQLLIQHAVEVKARYDTGEGE
jgi:hypothetical protein